MLAQADPTRLTEACGTDPDYLCRKFFEWTDSVDATIVLDWLVERPLKILFIVFAGWVLNRLVRRLLRRVARAVRVTTLEARQRAPRRLVDAELNSRAEARAEAVTGVLSSAASVVVWTVVVFAILGQLEIDLAPLIAGAGIAGIAIGFGAQSLVKDVLAGVFVLVEDQYGVGDIVDLDLCEGTVERMRLRSTQVRDVYGVVWHVPNGEVQRVGNKSQHWSRALLDVEVAYGADVRRAQEVIRDVARALWEDPEWGGDEIAEEPELWGVQALGPDAVKIRVVMKTAPAQQWAVEREFRLRVKEALDEAGIPMPYAQRAALWRADPPPDPQP